LWGPVFMSARFYKIFAAVLVLHLGLISVVWVGFPAPLPRPPARFTYEGALPADEAAPADSEQQQALPQEFNQFTPGAEDALSARWIKLRGLTK